MMACTGRLYLIALQHEDELGPEGASKGRAPRGASSTAVQS